MVLILEFDTIRIHSFVWVFFPFVIHWSTLNPSVLSSSFLAHTKIFLFFSPLDNLNGKSIFTRSRYSLSHLVAMLVFPSNGIENAMRKREQGRETEWEWENEHKHTILKAKYVIWQQIMAKNNAKRKKTLDITFTASHTHTHIHVIHGSAICTSVCEENHAGMLDLGNKQLFIFY